MKRTDALLQNIRNANRYKNPLAQFVDALHHKLRINTSIMDYYRYEFYKGELSWDEKALYLGPSGSRYWPYEGNSLKFERLFVHKSLQKAVLEAADVPTPEIVLKVGSNHLINSVELFRKEVHRLTKPVLTKFDGGGGGAGILLIEPDGDTLTCNGKQIDADWIWQQYASNLERGFIVEAKIDNHPTLAEIHPQSLNTIRINTVKTADGEWHHIGLFIKFGRGHSHVDNISAGGLFCGLDNDGVATAGFCRRTNSSFTSHPDTNCRIKGLKVPYFTEAIELAHKASRTFGFMATIGWDVAITPDGPMIIEGNTYWGFKGMQEKLGPFLTPEVASGLAPRYCWTPWDKTHMYPHYIAYYAGGWWQKLLARRRRYWQKRLTRSSQGSNGNH